MPQKLKRYALTLIFFALPFAAHFVFFGVARHYMERLRAPDDQVSAYVDSIRNLAPDSQKKFRLAKHKGPSSAPALLFRGSTQERLAAFKKAVDSIAHCRGDWAALHTYQRKLLAELKDMLTYSAVSQIDLDSALPGIALHSPDKRIWEFHWWGNTGGTLKGNFRLWQSRDNTGKATLPFIMDEEHKESAAGLAPAADRIYQLTISGATVYLVLESLEYSSAGTYHGIRTYTLHPDGSLSPAALFENNQAGIFIDEEYGQIPGHRGDISKLFYLKYKNEKIFAGHVMKEEDNDRIRYFRVKTSYRLRGGKFISSTSKKLIWVEAKNSS